MLTLFKIIPDMVTKIIKDSNFVFSLGIVRICSAEAINTCACLSEASHTRTSK